MQVTILVGIVDFMTGNRRKRSVKTVNVRCITFFFASIAFDPRVRIGWPKEALAET
jgi:hypothetical protein